ncbi:Wound-induced basic protein, partial [Bienertia sinuspersici]
KKIKGNIIIYDDNSHLFCSFLRQKGGTFEKRKTKEQKPKDRRPKAIISHLFRSLLIEKGGTFEKRKT